MTLTEAFARQLSQMSTICVRAFNRVVTGVGGGGWGLLGPPGSVYQVIFKEPAVI